MRHNDKINSWTDLNEHGYHWQPNIVIKAAEVTALKIYEDAEIWNEGYYRKVFYEDDAANRYYYEMIPFLMPSGAVALTIGSLSTAADGVVTYTPSAEGRLLGEDGALINTSSVANDIGGMLLTDYYYHFNDNLNQREHFRVITLEEGDFLWLVRNGTVYLDASGNCTDGRIAIVSSTVAGEVEDGVDLDEGGTIGDYSLTLRKNLLRDALPRQALGVGKFRESRVGAGMVKVDMNLGYRFYR